MNSRSHLIPTPTVDRNGKQTTVYRRQESTATAASFPGPSIPAHANRRGDDIDAVNNLIRDHANKYGFRSFRDELVDIIRGMSASSDENYPALVRETVDTVLPSAKLGTSMRAFIGALSSYDEEPVRAMHAHRNYLAANDNMIEAFFSIRKSLIGSLGIKPEPDGHMQTLETHLYAMKKYAELVGARGKGALAQYGSNKPLMSSVEKHPDRVPELMEFLGRGHDRLDLPAFEDYLNQGTLRTGSL